MSSNIEDFPVFDLAQYLQDGMPSEVCKQMAHELHDKGLLIVKDPRVDHTENDKFIDMMEKYFEQPEEKKMKDVRPEIFYQLGATPSNTERAKSHCEKFSKYEQEDRPVTECPPGADPKWRWFHRIGARPAQSKFAQLNADAVVPEGFPQWTGVMDRWGGLIMGTVYTVAEMAALGMGLEKDAFAKQLQFGPHLLAPTGSDLSKWGAAGTVFASYHYDLNFLTIHGRSRFPGLFVWTRSGKKILVKVPMGCLLLQAGKQFEWMTGGEVLAGFHEVVVVPDTIKQIEAAKANGESLWRISSTLFSHVASDNTLQVLEKFRTPENVQKYPATLAGDYVRDELEAIGLAKKEHMQK